MSRDDVRTYGDFTGISAEAFEALRPHIPFPQVRHAGDKLSVDHEGTYIDVEPFLEKVVAAMAPGGWGGLDFIDHVDWEVTRYIIRDGRITVKKVRPDHVLEPLLSEIGS